MYAASTGELEQVRSLHRTTNMNKQVTSRYGRSTPASRPHMLRNPISDNILGLGRSFTLKKPSIPLCELS